MARLFRTLILAALGGFAFAQPAITVRITLEGDPPEFRVAGSAIVARLRNPNFENMFRVTVDKDGAPPLAGDYRVDEGVLVFRTRYPLEPGLPYRASFHVATESGRAVLAVPKPPVVPTTRVERIYPSASILPENQLKFYVHFSAPMSRGEAARRIHLVEVGGGEVKLPFLELDEELWDREFRRLTILFDPGRVKRGLVPHNEAGTAIRDGRQYKIVIDAAWLDGRGVPLAAPYEKHFVGGPAERRPIDLKEWTVTPPAAGSASPLMVDFPRPLDAALLLRFLDVVDSAGKPVPGKAALDQGERRWTFTPASPWTPGAYNIEVVSTLEDLAGNKVGRPFDVDVFDRVDRQITTETHAVAFSVR